MSSSEATRFAIGGVSCMTAACVTNPIDVIKTRLQLQGAGARLVAEQRQYKGFLRGMIAIVRAEGVGGLYRGLSPSLLREGSYSTIRMGLYEPVKSALVGGNTEVRGLDFPLWKKICAGAVSGSIGAAIATPTDLVKVRMQAGGTQYKGVFHAFATIYRAEGFAGLYRGVGPTVQRATILTATQLPVYDHSKHLMLSRNWVKHDDTWAHFLASMTTGLVVASTTSPVDVVKTRIMAQPPAASLEQRLYRSALHCAVSIVRTEGLLALYKGFVPNYLRIGPHTMVTFVVMEKLRSLAALKPI
eukprot:TRINITY_DN3869_c0_g1_i1.p1 TRINITY_DN3869_c0_g1~~TRINITY_DN3869_c0_g1_i1.p1  ORF type:complete len:301 (-),score=49.99 TRINITY_DN3869_c0_g1_i1:29-931(-)